MDSLLRKVNWSGARPLGIAGDSRWNNTERFQAKNLLEHTVQQQPWPFLART
jgi:hypothetical protein